MGDAATHGGEHALFGFEVRILSMNALLNRMIAKEVGVNNGGFLPAALWDG